MSRVTVATSVDQTLDILTQHVPDVLVSDIGMPLVDSYELLQRVRALSTGSSKIPAILLTAYAREQDKRRALEAGFQACLAKPVDPDALARLVANLAHKD